MSVVEAAPGDAPAPPGVPGPEVIATESELAEVVRDAAGAERVAVDLEASGLYTYRARICTIQLAWFVGGAARAAVVDTIGMPLASLASLLGPAGPVKIVHDVAFDARLLAEVGLELGNVHDTSVAARMLARPATGLAALLESELGVRIGKELQQHDWRVRPFEPRMLSYLQQDVLHLAALDDRLWAEVEARGIAAEVLEETRYRLASAVAATRAPEPAPPYTRVKGVDRLAERELAVLRVVAELREREAMRRDVPPHRVASNDALLTLARARPRTVALLSRVRGLATSSPDAVRFVAELAVAIEGAGETLPVGERARFERPRPPAALVRAQRERETRLMAWRRREAAARQVDEQVVLPGHCVKHLAEHEPATLEELRAVPGLGLFRVERDGESLLRALRVDGSR